MHITLASHGITITLDSAAELDDALEALSKAVAHVRAIAPQPSPLTVQSRPALNDDGRAVVAYLSEHPGTTFSGALAAGHAKKTLDWLCKKSYLSFDSRTQLLTVA